MPSIASTGSFMGAEFSFSNDLALFSEFWREPFLCLDLFMASSRDFFPLIFRVGPLKGFRNYATVPRSFGELKPKG